jgi:hypothetical protein
MTASFGKSHAMALPAIPANKPPPMIVVIRMV